MVFLGKFYEFGDIHVMISRICNSILRYTVGSPMSKKYMSLVLGQCKNGFTLPRKYMFVAKYCVFNV